MTFDPTKPADTSGAPAIALPAADPSMRSVSIADGATGLFTGVLLVGSAEAIALNTPDGHIAVEGHHDGRSKKFDHGLGQVVDYTPPADPAGDAAAAAASAKASALYQIGELERRQHRALREQALGVAGAADRLKSIDDQITALRAHL